MWKYFIKMNYINWKSIFKVNAMYSPEMNSIWLPNGIQKLPVFGKNRLGNNN
jgi:predicted metalloendopeptidase